MNMVKNLDVYKKAHSLALAVYKATELFPKSELFGLVSQMRRAAVSINSNLCEGGSRNNDKEYKQFIGIAQGSAAELEYQLTLAKDLGYLEKTKAEFLIEESQRVLKMLYSLSKTIRPKDQPTK